MMICVSTGSTTTRRYMFLECTTTTTIGILGVLLYSLTKQYYEHLEAEAVAEAQQKKG